MNPLKTTICLVLTLCLLCGYFVMPAEASEDPLAVKDFEEFGASANEVQEIGDIPVPLVGEEPPSEAPAQNETKAAAEPETEPVTVPETEPETEPATEPTTEPATEPVTEPATEPTETGQTAPAEEITPEKEPAAGEKAVPVRPEQETVPEETVAAEPGEGETGRKFPQYFQTDYPDVRFGSGTVANNGCSVTSLAMVASYMTGHEYRPDELARYFGGRAENNIARLEMGSEALQLPHRKARDWHDAFRALQDGAVVIVLVDNRCAFTQSQHFVIMTGINKSGKVTVCDSYKPNYDKWELKKGFAEGFDPSEILQGYSGAWIYDVDAMPEDPFIYSEPEPVRGETRYPEIRLTLEQEDLLAKVVWAEARGECEAGQQAVAEIVLNRLASDRFPDTLRDVIYGEGQFRSAPFLKDAKPHQAQYEAIEKALYGPYILPEDVYFFATTPTTQKIWGVIGGHVFCYAEK